VPTAHASLADQTASPSSLPATPVPRFTGMARHWCPFQAASNGSNGAFWLASVKPDAQPSDGPVIASPVRLALAPAGTAGPGTVRHPLVTALADWTVNDAALMASAAAAALALMAGSHER
jgi:hypothetical protein